MTHRPILSDAFKQEVLTLFDRGLSTSQIVVLLGEQYRKESNKELTRNVCLGIKFRGGKCDGTKSKLRKEIKPDAKLAEEYGMVYRKCLCCGENRLIEKNMRICKGCKTSEWYESSAGFIGSNIY